MSHRRKRGIMRDDHYGHALCLANILQQLQHFLAGLVIERTGRFVAQQQLRLFGNRAGDGYTLLFAAGQLRGEVVHPLPQSDFAQRFPWIEMVRADLRGELHVFERGKVRHQIVELEDEADIVAPVGHQFLFPQTRNIASADHYAAGCGGIHAAQNVQCRGFAGTGLSQNHA